ncbi:MULTISPECIES: FbpB family small basic protein [Bacillaceae]|uniref:FbpB family small basic protein n=1 Tax=Evansella alkalicola TaxID=745819 RepID=A0ABS6JS33_9BACI|nr:MULTISPECIES: FbpB family small basic protein [Bacillaceae]MBU9721369.1 FbpB family small basic protein [Bacillus alkalicola]
MKAKKKMRFEELIQENKQALLQDPQEMERIEKKLEKKHQSRLPS